MTFFRVFIVMASVVRQVSVGPTVMSNHGVRWSCTVISVGVGEGGFEFCDVLQCLKELKLASSERCSEGAVSGCQSGYCGSVARSGGG